MAPQSSLTGRPIAGEILANTRHPPEARPAPGANPTPPNPQEALPELRRADVNTERTLDQDRFESAWSDPLARVLCAPVLTAFVGHAKAMTAPTIDRIASLLVRKVGVGSSSVHLEFGAGVFAEGTLLIQATDDGLEIALQTPAGVDTEALGAALTRRLTDKGICISRLEVT